MLEYFIIVLAIILVHFVVDTFFKKYYKKIFTFIAFFILTVFVICQNSIGPDYDSYIKIFDYYKSLTIFDIIKEHLGELVYNNEIGYKILNSICGIFIDDGAGFFRFVIIIIYALLAIGCYRFSSSPLIFILALMCINFDFTAYLRQGLAIGIVFNGFGLLKNKKLLRYMAVVVFAFLFHMSAIVCVAGYFIYHKFRSIDLCLLTGLISVIFLVVFRDQIADILQIIIDLVQPKYSGYINTDNYGPYLLIVNIFILFLCYAVLDLKNNHNRKLIIMLSLIVIIQGSTAIIPMSSRLVLYFYPFIFMALGEISQISINRTNNSIYLIKTSSVEQKLILCILLILGLIFMLLTHVIYYEYVPFWS